jgi:hypothetical protein
MKKLYNLVALAAMLSVTALMTGCGDDDDDDNGGGGAAAGPAAPANVNGQEVTITETGGTPRRLTFMADGSSYTVYESGTTNVVRTGMFQYTAANNTATLTLRDPDGSNAVTYNLTFSSATTGTFSYPGPNGQTITGTFGDLRAQVPVTPDPNPNPNPDPNPNPNPDPNPNPNPDTGTPPAAINGRTVVITATSGPLQGDTSVTFGAGSTFSASNTGSGNFAYTLTGTTANLTMDYTAPADFVGDRDVYVFTFNAGSGSAGTFTGTTRIDDKEDPHSGTFRFQ